ncbi:SusD/RagB family nutrient-binding outer membrane lipoprotein [Bacteroides faecium]|uniref:SusD/RagB family nutrient-binding outer membrane lipoprotein n=2 Tax=Bacteroides faecium TaxID=2715212 RepID=A0A6H0KT49_9BACE|nr:SusD/RagB family nutrient-binding outer membrane lipoprotein [Bacteroides faecium]
MKYLKHISHVAVALISLLALGSCMDADINRNPFETTQAEMERDNYIIGSNLKTLEAQVIPTQEHLYQFMEAMCGGSYGGYFSETRTGWGEKYSTYNPKSDWLKASFSDPIVNIYPSYRKILRIENAAVPQAIAKILRVAVMHRTTDMFGPIPYSKIISQDENADALSAAYDSQKDVYMQMFKELEEADKTLTENIMLDASALKKLDDVYYGNIEKWSKYLHSLQLRMAMRLSYIPEMKTEAQRIAETAVAAGVIEDNADNAQLHVAENRSALCFNNWGDYRIGADIICYMNGYQDPRLEKYFTKGAGKDAAGYYGLRIGIQPTGVSDDALISTYSNRLMTDTDPYIWMTAAEVAFLRAEGELRKWSMGGAAKDFYEKGIALSFDQYGVSGAAAYASNNSLRPSPYTDPLGKYNTSAPSSITIAWNEETEGNHFEENLERIITQKWIAIYPLGIEAWSEHRRTGYPKMLPIVDNKSSFSNLTDIGIRRLHYPAEEYSLDGGHVAEAVQMLGSDGINVRLWWDCNPNVE